VCAAVSLAECVSHGCLEKTFIIVNSDAFKAPLNLSNVLVNDHSHPQCNASLKFGRCKVPMGEAIFWTGVLISAGMHLILFFSMRGVHASQEGQNISIGCFCLTDDLS
jgi:hypothetical protein